MASVLRAPQPDGLSHSSRSLAMRPHVMTPCVATGLEYSSIPGLAVAGRRRFLPPRSSRGPLLALQPAESAIPKYDATNHRSSATEDQGRRRSATALQPAS
eukprot:scaffold4717_cov274-Pinguiococcus_pyrenoidosus.AAC.6